MPGYPSIMVVMLFLGGIQLMVIGVIGEYLGRTFDGMKRRPLYWAQGYEPLALARRMQRGVSPPARTALEPAAAGRGIVGTAR